MHEPKYHAHKAYSFGFPCQTKDAISLASLIHIVLIRSVGCFLFRFSPVRSETRPLCISCVFLGKKLASTGVFLNADGSIYNHIWEIIEVLKTTNWAPLWGCLLVQIPCQTKTLSTTTVTSKLVKGKERGGWGGCYSVTFTSSDTHDFIWCGLVRIEDKRVTLHYGYLGQEHVGLNGEPLLRVQRHGLKIHSRWNIAIGAFVQA